MRLLLNILLPLFFSLSLLANDIYSDLDTNKQVTNTSKWIGNKLAEKYNIQFLLEGSRDLVDSQRTEIFSWSFVDDKKSTLEEARPIILNIINDIYASMNEKLIYSKYLDALKKTWPSIDTRILIENVGIKLAFWDENVNRPKNPYLAQIKVSDGKIRYYYADPATQALGEPIVESFKEAYEKANSSSLTPKITS
jgi:hypothetical protein